MGKKSKIKKITEKQYLEYVAGLKNEPVHTPRSGSSETVENGENKQNSNNK